MFLCFLFSIKFFFPFLNLNIFKKNAIDESTSLACRPLVFFANDNLSRYAPHANKNDEPGNAPRQAERYLREDVCRPGVVDLHPRIGANGRKRREIDARGRQGEHNARMIHDRSEQVTEKKEKQIGGRGGESGSRVLGCVVGWVGVARDGVWLVGGAQRIPFVVRSNFISKRYA